MKIKNRPDLFRPAVWVGSMTGQTNRCHVVLMGNPLINQVKVLPGYRIFMQKDLLENVILTNKYG